MTYLWDAFQHRKARLMLDAERFALTRGISQSTLFPLSSDELTAEMQVSRAELREWHRKGWLSFDPLTTVDYDAPEFFEVLFIWSLVRFFSDDAMVNRLLHGLEKPYKYNPANTLYSFEARRWIIWPEEDPAEVTQAYIDHLEKTKDWPALGELLRRIADVFDNIDEESDE
jgi:hypothetical protein